MPGGLGPRTLVTLLIGAASVLLLSPILPGFEVSGAGDAVALTLIAGLLNALLWPVLVRIALPITVLTLGAAVLLLNGLVLLLAAEILPGVEIASVANGVLVALGVTLLTTVFAAILSIDDDARFATHLQLHHHAMRAARPYEIVVPSDHGQTQGTTFRDRYGITLEALVREACDVADEELAAEASGEDEAAGRLSAARTEASTGETAGGRAVRIATRGKTVDAEVRVLQEGDADGTSGGADPLPVEKLPEVSVMASGNLGLITFPRLPGRVTREQIESGYPQLLDALRHHPGVGFLLVRGDDGVDVVLGPNGSRRLDEAGVVEGDDPLAPYGPRAAVHVARTASFPHCPDIVLNSAYWEQTDEVCAFEELVGSHGGLGGPQAHPFLLAPADLPLPADEIVGAAHVHQVLRGWLVRLGHAAYADLPAPEPVP